MSAWARLSVSQLSTLASLRTVVEVAAEMLPQFAHIRFTIPPRFNETQRGDCVIAVRRLNWDSSLLPEVEG